MKKTIKPNGNGKAGSKKTAAKVKKATRATRSSIDNAKTLALIAQARKEGVNVKAATSVVRYIRSKGFGASNQVIAHLLGKNVCKRQYA